MGSPRLGRVRERALQARTWREGIRRQLWYLPALVCLGAWLAFFYAKTGTLTSKDAAYAAAIRFMAKYPDGEYSIPEPGPWEYQEPAEW